MVLREVFFGKSLTSTKVQKDMVTDILISIFQIPRLGMKLKQDSIPLSYTPRKFISHPTNRYLYLIEGDHRVIGEEAVNKRLQQLVGS